MAASLLALSMLPTSPSRLFLSQQNPAGPPISNPVFLSSSRSLRFPLQIARQINNRRPRPGEQAVARAGQPSASTLFLVFALPLSLLIGTIAVSLRIGRKLDEKFLEELAVHKALMEENEAEKGEEWEEDSNEWVRAREGEEERVLVKEEPGTAQIRNRPQREV